MRCVVPVLVAWTVAACGGSGLPKPAAAELTASLPATLEADRAHVGDARAVKIRVWADAAVRTRPTWKAELTDELDYASQLLTPLLGIRLVVEETKEWDYIGEPVNALPALQGADAGKDVTWVLGVVAPGEDATKVFSELAVAEPLGHHLIVRAWAEEKETLAVAATLPDLPEAERIEVIGAHRRHKQTVVLLHALAQSLGAIAETDPESIQSPLYSPKQHGFGDRNRALLQLTIDAWLAQTPNDELAKALVSSIESAEWGGWVGSDHDELLARLQHVVAAKAGDKTAAQVPAAAADQFERIGQLAKRGQTADALAELDNLLAAYPGNAAMYQLKCEILIAAPPGIAAAATKAVCARAGELAPGDPGPHLVVAQALAKINDLVGARAELVLAAARIANLPGGAEPTWRKIIDAYHGMGALTWTEEALAAAGLATDPIAAQVAAKRARYGIPAGSKVPPEQEGKLVAAIRDILDKVYAKQDAAAIKAIAAAEKQWPKAPGIAAARCDQQLRAGHIGEAKAACEQAIALDPHESWALYLGGVIALQDTTAKGTKLGITRLTTAISVDPELAQAWHALAQAYDRAKDTTAAAKLRADYQTKFGTALR